MAYDLEEQEQIENVKAIWKKYGNLLTWVLIVVLGAYSGWTFWNNSQRKTAAEAGQLFERLKEAAEAKDNDKVLRAATDMQEKYSKTAFAEIAALTAAKSAYEANDAKDAKAQLQLVISNGKNEEYQAVAKVRMAGILLDEKSYDDALKLLTGEFPTQYESLVADRKGDILVAQNKLPEARAAYQQALDKLEDKNPGRQLIQIKLDAIGGSPAKAAA